MHRRPFFHSQTEPGKKASNRYSSLLKEFERRKPIVAAFPAAAGLSAALALYLLRQKQLSNERNRRDRKASELNKLNAEGAACNTQPKQASRRGIDSFLASAKREMATELRGQIIDSELLIMEMESENPGYSFVRDAGFATATFAAAILMGLFSIKMLARMEERKAAIYKSKEQPKPREREKAVQMEDIAHAPTCIPAPAAPSAAVCPGKKFQKPEYYDSLFQNLKWSIREEMGPLGSEEAADAFLRVMKPGEIDELLNWPETIAVHIEKNRDALGEFLREKGIDPRQLFARLGKEVTDLF